MTELDGRPRGDAAPTVRDGPAGGRAALLSGLCLLAVVAAASTASGQAVPAARYWVYVANESSDRVSLLRFGPDGAVLEADIPVGIMPADIDGAHGLAVEPGGRHFYVSIAHGTPNGRLWKIRTGDHVLVDSVTLGRFPATVGITPDASLALVANFNLHGDPVPSTVSVVYLPGMMELRRLEACVKPHGTRVSAAGDRAYVVCVGDDQLVEISVRALEVSRRAGLGATAGPAGGPCGPTWAAPAPDGRAVYVACNARGASLEVDAGTLEVRRRFEGGKGPYNLALTSDGRLLVATNKGGRSVSVFDLRRGREVARIPTTRPVTHGVTISPDDRYAFVSNEAVGAVRGTVDVIDLAAKRRVASVQVHHQPGGIDFWKMERVGRESDGSPE
jgi:DNA-binding beta-propeller fold protein YncE